MIRLGESVPRVEPRRLGLGVDKMLALIRAAEEAGIGLPADLGVEIDPVQALMADVDPEAVLAEASEALREHGVIDDQGPVRSVAANLAGLGGAQHRLRVSVSGAEVSRLGYFWADADLAGGVVRDVATYTLSLFDSRDLLDEVMAMVPDSEFETTREAFTVPLGLVGPLGGMELVDEEMAAAMATITGMPPRELGEVQEWLQGVRAVLHVTAVGSGWPFGLVWFLDRGGWWAGSVAEAGGAGEERLLDLVPRGRGDLAGALAELMVGAWQ
jgi:hypothetical protein